MRRNKIEKQLEAALQDATQPDLPIHHAKLIQSRIVALTKLFEYQQASDTARSEIERLTAELDRVKEDNRLLTEQLAAPKPIDSLREIDEVLKRYAATKEEKQQT